jgi:predicted ATPase
VKEQKRVLNRSEAKPEREYQTYVNNQNLYVVTGGPGSGKTTVLLELEKCGYLVAPEVARQIIQEQVREKGTALPWIDPQKFAGLMLQRSIESFVEHTPCGSIIFSDRGIPDTLAYARHIGMQDQTAIKDACNGYRYAARVFLAPWWPEIYETDSERKQDFAEAERTAALMTEIYRECGYEVVELPKATPRHRAEFILRELGR